MQTIPQHAIPVQSIPVHAIPVQTILEPSPVVKLEAKIEGLSPEMQLVAGQKAA
jgi:hypothetical protein